MSTRKNPAAPAHTHWHCQAVALANHRQANPIGDGQAARPWPERVERARRLARAGVLHGVRPVKPSISMEKAMEIILDAVRALDLETVPLLEANGRVLGQDIISPLMVPPLDCSAMDGYAVKAADTRGAAPDCPVRLQVRGESRAGGGLEGLSVSRGGAVRIMTGALMPPGADAVVQVEETEEEHGFVRIFSAVAPYQNYRRAGESIAPGDRVLLRGERLRPADLGLLAALNQAQVVVHRRPTVAVISTGDELAGLGQRSRPGGVHDVNAYTLCAEIQKYGGRPQYLGIARDSLAELQTLFRQALATADVVISTGGVSMGRYDLVKDIHAALGIQTRFEWIDVKPGKPCVFGTKDDVLVFGLPGSPVASLTSFIQFVRPALLRLMGARRIHKPVVEAILTEDIDKSPAGKVHLLRGRFTLRDHRLHVATTGNQKSSLLRSMSEANCLIVLPADRPRVKAGEKVIIQLIDHDEV